MENYGDVNYWEHGGIFVEQLAVETEFRILYLQPLDDMMMEFYKVEPERKFYFADCYVDTEDSWINRESVMDSIDMTEETFDLARYAIGCLEFYGCVEFNSEWNFEKTEEEVREVLEFYGVE